MIIDLPLVIQKDLSYKIHLGKNNFNQLQSIIKNKLNPDKTIVITDENVHNIYSIKIKSELLDKIPSSHLLIVKPGERSKSQKVRDQLENDIISLKPSRNSILIALGGGVVGDLTGFLASTILRGIRYIQVPTTIISQVDSSIGGKTGINTKHSKNLVGTFYQPAFVLIDTKFLETLPESEFKSGLGEILKSLLIGSREGFDLLEKNYKQVLERQPKMLNVLIQKSVKTKVAVIRKDPEEKGLRKILNFGHTIGHAIESLSKYKLNHGFAVTEGILVESYLSFISNGLSEVDLFRIQYIVNALDIDSKMRQKFTFQDVYEKMKFDKKKINDQITFSLIPKIGKCDYNKIVSKELVEIAYSHSL